jgi:hypothetical protein
MPPVAHDELRQVRSIGYVDEPSPSKLNQSAKVEIHDDFVVFHALAALDRAEVTNDAVMSVAHSSQSAVSEHAASMHCPPIPSNLDGGESVV